MLERLALATLIGGLAGYCLAKHLCQHEGEQRFNELMDALPDEIVFAIDAHIHGEPLITASYPE